MTPDAKICSAWNWSTLTYTYYQCPGTRSLGGWNRPKIEQPAPGGGLGVSIEDALPQLPLGCKPIGTGPDAIGQIVRPVGGGVSGGFGIFPQGFLVKHLAAEIAVGVVTLLAVRWLLKRK